MNTPKIMNMDWKSLGYEKEYKNGRFVWVPSNTNSYNAKVEEQGS